MDGFCYLRFVVVFFILSCLFLAAVWSSAGKGLTFWDSGIMTCSSVVVTFPYGFLGQVLFCCFTSQVNSYGHCGTVSSLNHTLSWASLNKQLTSTSSTYFRL